MTRTTSKIAPWVIGVIVVLFVVSCLGRTMVDSTGCADHMDQYGACLVVDPG